MNQSQTMLIIPRTTPRLSRAALAVGLLACLTGGAAWAFDSGSTGADGVLNPAVSTEIVLPPSGVLNYTSINIPAGVTVKFKKNALNTPAYLLVSGNVTIAGVIDLRGEDGKHSGTYGDGSQADDGIPGAGAVGGFDGGRGGRDDLAGRPGIIRGGAGLGPGGGKGGIEGASDCNGTRYIKYYGMGAGFATAGSSAWYRPGRCVSEGFSPDQAKAYGTPALQPLIGGSGGGGGVGGLNFPGSGGGGGGGALLIAASGSITITSPGNIDATGGDAGGASGTNSGQQGGGGSGGAIRLIATTIAGNGALSANGGCANINGSRRQECLRADWDGLGGAPGRIRLEADSITYSGASSPAYVPETPKPVFVSNAPSIRITSIGGSSVPATPTGNADVALPANITNPVTVNFETANVPTGNTIKLRVVPAYGDSVEVLSPAITGTTAAGATSVSVTLPQGPSVLQAITSFTVTVAQADALQHFAQNERVEKVELIAAVGGATRAELVTVSGKRFAVPLTVLQMAGVTG